MTSLVFADHDGVQLSPATLNTVTAATTLGAGVDILVVGKDCAPTAEAAAAIRAALA